MAKLLEHGTKLWPIVITDCKDNPTKQFLEQFCGGSQSIF